MAKAPAAKPPKTYAPPPKKPRGPAKPKNYKPITREVMPEVSKPEETADLISRMAGDTDRIRELAEACGLPALTVNALVQRVRTRYLPVKAEMKRLSAGDLIAEIEGKISMTLQFLDPIALEGASAKDLAIILGILIEKSQLLKGEPTQIITTGDRTKLADLMTALSEEAKRRGHGIELREQPDGTYAATGLSPSDPTTHPRMGGRQIEREE